MNENDDDDILIEDGSTLYTLEGCPHCDNMLDKVTELIESGMLKRMHCNPVGTDEERDVCEITSSLVDFEGFPSIYSIEGKKII